MAKKKKIPRASKKRLIVFGTLSCVILAYAIMNLCIYSYQIKKLSEQKESLGSELNELKETEENLQTEINKLQDEDYLARYARENYLYTKDGEYVIQVNEKEEEISDQKTEVFFEENKKVIIFGSIVLFIMIICIIFSLKGDKKKKRKNL